MIGEKRIPVQVEYSPILTDAPDTLNLSRSLTELRNTTFQASGSLTLADLEMLGQLLWDHSPTYPYYPPMSESLIDIRVIVERERWKSWHRIRADLLAIAALSDRLHRAKLRKRRKHRAMFRRKKRGLA